MPAIFFDDHIFDTSSSPEGRRRYVSDLPILLKWNNEKIKKKFLNCIIGVEESRPKLRFRSKLRLKDPRYVNLNFFEIIGWKNSILSNLKKSLFFRCQNERFFYVDYKKKVYIYIGESISKKWCANFALFVRKKNFWPFRDLRTIYVNIDITPAIIVTFVW